MSAVAWIASTFAAPLARWMGASIFSRATDVVSLEAKLSVTGEYLGTVGCAGVLVVIVCRSKRHAKFQGTYITLRDFDPFPAVQRAFESDFGHVPVPGAEPSRLFFDLIAISKRNSSEGYDLGRDDVARFLIPIVFPILSNLLAAPSEDIEIGVTNLDGSTSRINVNGFEIQTLVRALLESWWKVPQTLRVPLSMRIEGTSATPPESSAIGKLNRNPLMFTEREPSSPPNATPPEGQ